MGAMVKWHEPRNKFERSLTSGYKLKTWSLRQRLNQKTIRDRHANARH